MAHYTFLDDNNVVTEVIVGKDEGEGGKNWELHYGTFRNQRCKRTSYNTNQEMLLFPQNHLHHGNWMKILVYGLLQFPCHKMVKCICGTKKPRHGMKCRLNKYK